MASLGNPRTWIPYMNSKDCSQGFCSPQCPQWCYVVYPPPQPFEYPEDDDSSPSFSPLVIAIIGILATAFLLVSYYAVISKYCGRRSSRNPNDHELQENHHIHVHEPWHYLLTAGLDEALINSIPVCKYTRRDGSVEVTDCSVCLSEIEDGESVRLLPKCSHAFHLPCIDTWLKSQSTCPLCRAAIFATPQVPAATAMELPSRDEASPAENESLAVGSGNEFGVVEEEGEGSIPGTSAAATTSSDAPKPAALRAFSDLGNMQGRHRIIEIRDEVYEESIGRSVSMDHHSFQEQQDSSRGIERCSNEAAQSKRCRGESSKFSYKRKVLHCVLSPIAMKRSFSSGRFSLTSVRGRQGIIPL